MPAPSDGRRNIRAGERWTGGRADRGTTGPREWSSAKPILPTRSVGGRASDEKESDLMVALPVSGGPRLINRVVIQSCLSPSSTRAAPKGRCLLIDRHFGGIDVFPAQGEYEVNFRTEGTFTTTCHME